MIYGLFLLSGMTSLIYEVIWVRLLTLTFGAAAFAVASVLLAYMGGLCAGSFWIGKRADRIQRPLRLYGALELLIGGYALILPFVLERAGTLYVVIYQHFEPSFYPMSLIRLACSTIVLAVPTFLMGGTMPLLAAYVTRRSGDASRKVASLYAINTLGAGIGCLLAGYLLIPHLGLRGTTIVASAGNAAICLSAVLLGRKLKEPRQSKRGGRAAVPAVPADSPEVPKSSLVLVLTCLSLSGLCAMAYQTLWTRLLAMVIGTTVYAFTGMLAAFLLGLVLGGLLYRGWFARQPFLAFALSQLGIGLFVLGTMPFFDQLPFVFLRLFALTHESWVLYQISRVVLVLTVLIWPTTCFGIAFPLVVKIAGAQAGKTGRTVGMVYGINTLGAIVGSFAGGFVLIPFLGVQRGLMLLALINLVCGLALLLCHPTLALKRKIQMFGTATALTLVAALALRPWNLHYLNSGPYVYAHDYNNTASVDELKTILDSYELRFFQEDATATVSVLDILGTRSLAIDGKTDASTGEKADMSTQILLTELPAMISRTDGDSLLVGLGSGVSLGSLLKHKVPSVDVLEISTAVTEASKLFGDYNYEPLKDPRVNLIVGDGRHHLQRTKKSYNLIVSQPSNPWISGVASLFTTEYYRLMRDHLTDEGLVCQWIPSYHMSREMLAVILKSFTSVFPHATLWTSSVPGDLFAIGSKSPIRIDYPHILARLQEPGIHQDLARIGMNDSTLLAKTFKYDEAQVKGFVANYAAGLPENTDVNPVVEFMTPKFLLTQRAATGLKHQDQLTGDLAALLGLMHFEKEANRLLFSERAGSILNR